MSLSTVVQVGYETDLDTLMPRILEVVRPIKRVIADPAPSVVLSSFAADGLELTVSFWIADPENGTGGVKSDVNLALLRLFNELGVEIPYPQRVVRTLAIEPGQSGEGVVPGEGVAQATRAVVGDLRGAEATSASLSAPAAGPADAVPQAPPARPPGPFTGSDGEPQA
jgi:small-conductance mechanosensitive channel